MMYVRVALISAFLFLAVPICGLPAQEAASPAQEAASPPQPGPQKAEFDRLFAEWKELLAELGVLKVNYQEADEQERPEIQKKWNSLIAKGDALEPQLTSAAEKAFLEAPNADKELTDLLVDVLIGHVETRGFQVQTDNYEEARRLAKLLIENQCNDKRVYNVAGIAAFVLHDFDTAEEYLKLAKQEDSITNIGKAFLENIPQTKKAWTKEKEIRQAEAKADDLPRVLLKTNKGDVELELFENEAPNTVANFVSLVEKGYYDGLTFHRVIPGFMAQGGCPVGDGTGGPGYYIPCECYPPDKFRLHFRGSLSMAKSEPRNTGGSQFFLTFLPTSHLDGRHTAFGRVIKGLDVLHKLQRRNPQQPSPPEPDKILQAKVLRKRKHEYKPTTLPER